MKNSLSFFGAFCVGIFMFFSGIGIACTGALLGTAFPTLCLCVFALLGMVGACYLIYRL